MRKPYSETEMQTETEHQTETGRRKPYTTTVNQNGMPSIEDFLQGHRDLSGHIALAFGLPGPTHEAARLHDHLRLLEDEIDKELHPVIRGWRYVRDELKEKVRKFGELALEPLSLHNVWQAEVRFEYNRKFELIKRRWEEHLKHGETREDWDPLKILGVLPFEQWVKQLLEGKDLFRSCVVSGERSAPLLTRQVAHLIVYDNLGCSDKADG